MQETWGVFEIPWQNNEGKKYVSLFVARTVKEASNLLYGVIGGKDKLDSGDVIVDTRAIKKLSVASANTIGTYHVGKIFDIEKAHLIADHLEHF
jgi:hypothetical protein